MDDDDDDLPLSPAWRQADKALFESGRFKYGDLVPHEELQAALELPKPTGRIEVEHYERWRLSLVGQMDALAVHLLETRNMCLQAVPGQGYRIVEPAKQTEYATSEGMRRVRSELRKMGRRLSYVDRTQLSVEQARDNANALARLSFLSEQTNKARRLEFGGEPE